LAGFKTAAAMLESLPKDVPGDEEAPEAPPAG